MKLGKTMYLYVSSDSYKRQLKFPFTELIVLSDVEGRVVAGFSGVIRVFKYFDMKLLFHNRRRIKITKLIRGAFHFAL
jgi:hypothetical protein